MYVVSPWSAGGWVNSQVHDHTSIGMFLEKRFGIHVDSISPWRRAVCGDLTSAFDFATPSGAGLPALPDVSDYAAIEQQQRTLPAPSAPSYPTPSLQELGTRNSRALPYELHTSARVTSDGMVELIFSNTGTQGAVYHVYDMWHLDRIPRRYTVEAGKMLSDTWNTLLTDDGNYELWVYGPNGFVRVFKGNQPQQTGASFIPEIQVCYEPTGNQIYLKVHNAGQSAGSVVVTANAYRTDGPWTINVDALSAGAFQWNVAPYGGWYDFTVTADFADRRFAGRMETGQDSTSDPAVAQTS